MQQIPNYGDKRQTAWCVHCGGSQKDSRDHVPSKVLLDEPYPYNLPVVDICPACNQGFSEDEEYLACFLECVVCGTTDPEKLERQNIRRILQRSPKLRIRIEKSKRTDLATNNEHRMVWVPEDERVRNVFLKLARGHALSELNEPMFDEPANISIIPLVLMDDVDRKRFEGLSGDFELAGWPEVGCRAMQRLITGEDLEDGWVVVQPGRYRFQTIADGAVKIKIVLREYLGIEIVWTP
ncbi:MAG: hypothetical protein KGI97_05590 [Alphaproteobacteria bacterium]|nr:hypothetical protein [Alphaproteobacteria bacterium]